MTQRDQLSRTTHTLKDGRTFVVYRDETVPQDQRMELGHLLEMAISAAPKENVQPALSAGSSLTQAAKVLFDMAQKRTGPPPTDIFNTIQGTAFSILVRNANRLNAMVSVLRAEEPEIAKLIGALETSWPVSISDMPNMEATLDSLIEAVHLGIECPLYDTARARRKPSVAKYIVTTICRLSDALLALNIQSQLLQLERGESDEKSVRSARAVRNQSWRKALHLIRSLAHFLDVSHELTMPKPLLKAALHYSIHPGRVTSDTINAWAAVVRHFIDILCSGRPERNSKLKESIAKSKKSVKRHLNESLTAQRKRSADNVRAGMYGEMKSAIKSIAWKSKVVR